LANCFILTNFSQNPSESLIPFQKTSPAPISQQPSSSPAPTTNNESQPPVQEGHGVPVEGVDQPLGKETDLQHWLKKDRLFFFHNQLNFLKSLTALPFRLKESLTNLALTKIQLSNLYSFAFLFTFLLDLFLWEQLKKIQEETIKPSSFDFNASNPTTKNLGVYFPIGTNASAHQFVVRILPEESFCLSTKERVFIIRTLLIFILV
jgi:hypothetical protein